MFQGLKIAINVDVHALEKSPHLGCLSVVLRQMLQAASVDFFEVGLTLPVISKYFVEKTNRVVDSHDWRKYQRSLLLLVSLLKVF